VHVQHSVSDGGNSHKHRQLSHRRGNVAGVCSGHTKGEHLLDSESGKPS
jgi:hypothetical protein